MKSHNIYISFKLNYIQYQNKNMLISKFALKNYWDLNFKIFKFVLKNLTLKFLWLMI